MGKTNSYYSICITKKLKWVEKDDGWEPLYVKMLPVCMISHGKQVTTKTQSPPSQRTCLVLSSRPLMSSTPTESASSAVTSNSSSVPILGPASRQVSTETRLGLRMLALKQPCTRQPTWLTPSLLTVPWEQKQSRNKTACIKVGQR